MEQPSSKKDRNLETADIPVAIITLDDSAQQQNTALELGAKNYIVKPFVPAAVRRRVNNVLESACRCNKKLHSAGQG